MVSSGNKEWKHKNDEGILIKIVSEKSIGSDWFIPKIHFERLYKWWLFKRPIREKRKDEYLYILDFSWVYMASVDSGQVYGSTKIAY